MGHQLTVLVLQASQYIRHGVVDLIGRTVADICKVSFLDCVSNLLHKSLLHSCHLSEKTHFFGVCDPHVGICVGGCSIWDDEQTRVSQVDKGSGQDERVLRIREY